MRTFVQIELTVLTVNGRRFGDGWRVKGRMVATISLLLATHYAITAVQPIYKVYRSVDVMALSGASMVGIAVRIEPPSPGGEQIKPCVVFRNCVTINWYGAFSETGAFLNVDKAKIDEWIRTKSRILSFDGGDWVNLDDPEERFFDSRLHRIRDLNEVIGRLCQVYRDHPEIERVRPFYRPFSAQESRRLGLEPNARLAVPYDREVERWAVGLLKSKEWFERGLGVDALQKFENPANVKRLALLLQDPYQTLDSKGQPQFPVRERARRVLASWIGVQSD